MSEPKYIWDNVPIRKGIYHAGLERFKVVEMPAEGGWGCIPRDGEGKYKREPRLFSARELKKRLYDLNARWIGRQ